MMKIVSVRGTGAEHTKSSGSHNGQDNATHWLNPSFEQMRYPIGYC